MKNFLKKYLSLVLVAILAAGTIGTYLPGASAEATGTTEMPKYMAKMVPTSNEEYNRVGQRVSNVKAGNKYNISYKAYVLEAGSMGLYANESANVAGVTSKVVSGSFFDGIGSYTATESQETNGFIYFNFQCWSGAFYVWDVKITLDGGDGKNLLSNPDWSQDSGSWMNWIFSGYNGGYYKMTNTLPKSHAYENTSGRKVILYNADLFSQNVKNREQAEVSGKPAYMAKISRGTPINQKVSVSAVEGDTYVLSFSHYNITASNMQLRVGYSSKINDTSTMREDGKTYKYLTVYNSSTSGQWINKSIEYSLNAGEDSLTVRIEGTGATASGYVWGLSLTKKGGDGTNLLNNANFCDGGGSWIGWNVNNHGDIKTVAQSEAAETNKNCPIVAYNPNLFSTTNTNIALWSVQPVLEASLDLNYKTTLTSTPDEGTVPKMTFVMTDGEKTVKTASVTGTEIGTNKYSFGFVVLPQHMANTITATLSYTVGGETKEEIKTYSVKQYCGTLLSYDDNTTYMKNLVADLMRYGAQTQAVFGKTDSITSGLTSFMNGYGSNAALVNADYLTSFISGDNASTYKWKSASLVLDGKVTIRLKFTTDEDISTLNVKVGNTTYSKDGENTIQSDSSSTNGYYIDIPMKATAFDETITANFSVGDETTGATLKYSVNTYLHRKREGSQKNLLNSIYKYGQSADVYSNYIVYGTVPTLDNEISDEWTLQ